MRLSQIKWAGLALWLALTPASVALAQDLFAQKALVSARYPRIHWVTTEALARQLARADRPPFVLLDARAIEEFSVSHIRGARHVDPDLRDLDSLHIEPEARVVVYCSVGWRSGTIADRLRRAGFRHVYNLEGGIFQWANEGRALVSGDRAATVVHPYDATWGRMLNPERRARSTE